MSRQPRDFSVEALETARRARDVLRAMRVDKVYTVEEIAAAISVDNATAHLLLCYLSHRTYLRFNPHSDGWETTVKARHAIAQL